MPGTDGVLGANCDWQRQLAYLEKVTPTPFIDAIFGSSDALLFDIDKLITKIDLESSQFYWISKQTCLEEFGRLTNEAFLDFGLLLGSQFLRTFPPFETYGKGVNVRDALNMFNAAGRSALGLCAQFEEDRRVQELQYLDRYKRAYMTVKHHVYTDVDGRVGPMDPEHAPSDVHELIGQRLPEELYFYLSKGVLGPKVPNYLTSGEVVVPLPLGVEDSAIYRQLAGESLMPIRTQALCLLSNCLHRFYQTKVINARVWYEENSDQTINLKALPSVKETIQSWKISYEKFPESLKKIQVRSPAAEPSITHILTWHYLESWFAQVRCCGPERPRLPPEVVCCQRLFCILILFRSYTGDVS